MTTSSKNTQFTVSIEDTSLLAEFINDLLVKAPDTKIYCSSGDYDLFKDILGEERSEKLLVVKDNIDYN